MSDKRYVGNTTMNCEGCIHLVGNRIRTGGIDLWENRFCFENCTGFPQKYEAGEILETNGKRGMW